MRIEDPIPYMQVALDFWDGERMNEFFLIRDACNQRDQNTAWLIPLMLWRFCQVKCVSGNFKSRNHIYLAMQFICKELKLKDSPQKLLSQLIKSGWLDAFVAEPKNICEFDEESEKFLFQGNEITKDQEKSIVVKIHEWEKRTGIVYFNRMRKRKQRAAKGPK